MVVYGPFLNLYTTVIAPNYEKKRNTFTYKKPHKKAGFIKSNTFFPLIYQEYPILLIYKKKLSIGAVLRGVSKCGLHRTFK